jgi:hypothetical protein
MAPPGQLIPLLLFALLVSAAALQGLAATGHFPLQRESKNSAVRPKRVILFTSIGAAVLGLIVGSVAALRLMPLPAAIIAGGLSLLFCPLLLRALPDRFVDGAGALIAFAAATLAAAVILIWLVTRCGASC